MHQKDNTIMDFESQYLKTNVSLLSYQKRMDEIIVFNDKQIISNDEENVRALVEEYNKSIQSNEEIEVQGKTTRDHLKRLIKTIDNVNQFIVDQRSKMTGKCSELIEGLIKPITEKKDNEIKQLKDQINGIEMDYKTKKAGYEKLYFAISNPFPFPSPNISELGGSEQKLSISSNVLESNNQNDLISNSVPFSPSNSFGEPSKLTECIEKKEELNSSVQTVSGNSDSNERNEEKIEVKQQDEIKDEKCVEIKEQSDKPSPFIFDGFLNPVLLNAFSPTPFLQKPNQLQEQTNVKKESQQHKTSIVPQFSFSPSQPLNQLFQQTLGDIVQSTEPKSREIILDEDSELEDSESEEDIYFEPAVRLQEVEQKKSIENIIFKDRCQCFIFDNETKEFKERGTGEIRILKNPVNGLSQVVLIRDQILKLACEHYCLPYIKIIEIPNNEKLLAYTVKEDYAQDHRNPIIFAMVFNSKEIRNNFIQIFLYAQEEAQNTNQN